MGVVPIERMVASFQPAPRWPPAPRIEAAVHDGPPEAAPPIKPLAAVVDRARNGGRDLVPPGCRHVILRFSTVGGLHHDTIPTAGGRRQARCVIICGCRALYFAPCVPIAHLRRLDAKIPRSGRIAGAVSLAPWHRRIRGRWIRPTRADLSARVS